MAKGKKTGGKDFKPGHGMGRPKLPEEIKQASNLTLAESRAKLSKFLYLTMDELEAVLRDKSMPVMDMWIARIALMGLKAGDYQRLNFMFDRLIGKVKDQVDLTIVEPTIIEFSDGRVIEMDMKKTGAPKDG